MVLQPPGEGNANALDTDNEKTLLIDGTESLYVLTFCNRYNCTVSIGELNEFTV